MTPTASRGASQLSLFRRPLPATNLRFLTAVMWDGRESFAGQGTIPILSNVSAGVDAAALFTDLKHQANDATLAHAQATTPLADDVAEAIVQFELNLATGRKRIPSRRRALRPSAQGGPAFVATQPFYVTINDVLGADTSGAPFNPDAMTLFARGRHRTIPNGLRSRGEPRSSARSRSTSPGSAGSTTRLG